MADQVRKERVGISAWSRDVLSPQHLPGFQGNRRAGISSGFLLMAAAVLLLRGNQGLPKDLKVSMSNFVVFSKLKN